MSVLKYGMAVAIACVLAIGSTANANLIITGVFDGPLPGGDPKGVEIYATADVADLTQYAIGSANNGGGTDGQESGPFPAGSLSKGDFYYLTNGDGTDFTQWFGFAPNYPSVPNGAVNHNGDDALELFFDPNGSFAGGESVIDTFGDPNQDGSGEPWDSLDGWGYRNDGVGANGGAFNAANWSFSGPNEWDGDDLGDDSGTNAGATPPFPIGTYNLVPEPATLALMLLGLTGAVATRRRL